MNLQNHANKRPRHRLNLLKVTTLVMLCGIDAAKVDAWQMKQAPLMTP